MLYRLYFTVLLNLVLVLKPLAQKEIRSFIFGHSLIHHEYQVHPTPSQETSIPHWIHFLADHAGHNYKVSGQYGFLPQHANLPPIAQWGFDYVEGVWDSDNEPFSGADFNNIMITPGNFIQWQEPTENYPSESVSPISATEQIFNWCIEQEDSLKFYIYENWPDMAPYLNNGFPPTMEEWSGYNENLNGAFHQWFLEYHDILVESLPNVCIKMIPVGPIINILLNQAPYNEISIDELYEDDAPHGRPNIYFLASLISYMAIYEEKVRLDYEVESIIHPIISENFESIVNIIWNELQNFNFEGGNSRVFCDSDLTSSINKSSNKNSIAIMPNPVSNYLSIKDEIEDHIVDIYGIDGQCYLNSYIVNSSNPTINLENLNDGFYMIIGRSKSNEILYQKKFVKH